MWFATNWQPAPPLVAAADASTSDTSDVGWILAGCGVVVVTTIMRQRRDEAEHAVPPVRQRRPSRPEPDWDGHEPVPLHAEQVDQVFARFDFDPDEVAPRPVATLAPAAFAAETVTRRQSPNCPGIAMRPAPPPLPSFNHRPRRTWSAVTVAGVLLAACCFWQGLPAITSLWREEARADVAVEAPQRELVYTQIKDLRPCQRLIARNPQLAGQDVPERKIDPSTDRLVSFKLTHPDGSFVEWERVESLPELLLGVLAADATAFDKLGDEATAAEFSQSLIGRTLDVELSEFGVSGPATIVGVAPCPEPEAYDHPDRRLITAVFRHTSRNIVDVTLDDGTPGIGCTGNHPYWSVDRQDFLRADELRRGETLQRADGSHCHVASVIKRNLTEPVTVYNLEVDGHHVYCVGEGGVLVHNLCAMNVTPRTGGGIVPSLQGNVPQADKWIRSGGRVVYGADGSMTYIKNGVSIRYNALGYPDFSNHLYNGTDGLSQVRIKLTGSRLRDEAAANAAAGFEQTPDWFTWHHHEDLGFMQLVDERIHGNFWHRGGFSLNK